MNTLLLTILLARQAVPLSQNEVKIATKAINEIQGLDLFDKEKFVGPITGMRESAEHRRNLGIFSVGSLKFSIGLTSGKVYSVTDTAISSKIISKESIHDQARINTQSDVESSVKSLVSKLSVPKEWGTPVTKSTSNREVSERLVEKGILNVQWEHYLSTDCLIGPYVSVQIDRQSGKAISLLQNFDYVMETEKKVVRTAQQAVSLVSDEYEENFQSYPKGTVSTCLKYYKDFPAMVIAGGDGPVRLTQHWYVQISDPKSKYHNFSFIVAATSLSSEVTVIPSRNQ